ncbi:hypothetical protein [Caulobacter hibisci]|uniref:Uncharacterized protein n=1 Tax=Caulobacter hibisci TaxID=2035993 RepID=A0ABS0SWI1_9CAUL|nr:hypothetical protein [Caulobacter hibisci]MBI1683068.1 hypothetical protein [Caulobacter hibisci]
MNMHVNVDEQRAEAHASRKLANKLSVDGRCAEARVLAADVDLDLARMDTLSKLTDPAAYEKCDKRFARLEEGFFSRHPSEQIAAAVDLKKTQVQGYEGEQLFYMLTYLRERYVLAVGTGSKHAAAQASVPSTGASPSDSEPARRAEALSLLESLKLLYTLSSERELLTTRMRYSALWLLAVLFVALLPTLVLPRLTAGTPIFASAEIFSNYAVIAVVGAAGAMVSILRRAETAMASASSEIDPVRQVSALRHGRTAVLISAFVGAAVSFVLLAFFASGLATGGKLLGDAAAALFPLIKAPQQYSAAQISFMSHPLRFETHVDSAKMLVWAFIGGFSEQLVPDVLDRLTKAARPTKATAPSNAA